MATKLMQISNLKMQNENAKSKILFVILALVLLGAVIFWFIKSRQTSPVVEQPLVRDEFIDKLVATADQPYPLLVQGRKYYEQGQFTRAQKLFKKATELDRNYRDAFYHLGLAELALGHSNQALWAFTRAKTLDPIYKPTYTELVKLYSAKGDMAKAQVLQKTLDTL